MSLPAAGGRLEPRVYRPRMSRLWWLRKPSYLRFILRELSSVFVAWFVVFLLVMMSAVSAGESRYREFLDWAANPWVVVLNVVALGFVLFHTVTWFALTPQAMVVRLRGQRVPGKLIVASQYVGLVAVTAFVLWLLAGAGR